jgi:hypothetical protein
MSGQYLDPEYEYHEFYLDSKDATTSADGNRSSLNLPIFNLATPLKDVQSFKVLEAQIPLSYCITAGITFKINYYDAFTVGSPPATPKITKVVTLPSTGNPTGAQIANFINGSLSLATGNDPTALAISRGTTITGWTHSPSNTYIVCSFEPAASSSTGLPYFSFVVSTENTQVATTSRQDFSITIESQGARDIMGFPLGTTFCEDFGVHNSTKVNGKYVWSPNPTLITGAPYVYVTSNTIGNLCKTYLPLGASLLGGGVSSPQLAKIPVSNVVQGQWLVWQDSNNAWFDCDNIDTLSQLDLFIQLGNYGGFIDFQGLSFSLKLGVLVKRSSKVGSNGRGTFIQSTPFFMNGR